MSEPKRKCSVRDGKFVDPCDTLEKATDRRASEGTRKGLIVWPLVNTKTWEPSRTMYGARTDEYAKGILFNFCPFCGVQIDAPAYKAEEADHA